VPTWATTSPEHGEPRARSSVAPPPPKKPEGLVLAASGCGVHGPSLTRAPSARAARPKQVVETSRPTGRGSPRAPRGSAETTRRSKALSTRGLRRRPTEILHSEEPCPHRTRAAQVANHLGPEPPDLIRGREQPHVAAIGLTQQRSEPIASPVRIRISRVCTQLPNRAIRLPQAIRARVFALERIRGGRERSGTSSERIG
jgi:hypothetical protein